MRTPIWSSPDPMYTEFEVHRSMIRDRVRTDAFRRAIEATVQPGAVVLDVGAGSGILSLFAARAGAARVYAVEVTSIAVLAQELAAANGVSQVVQVIQEDMADVELPEHVDVIVSEWLGGFGIDEGMLPPVITARDRWLKPGGIMIPRSVTAWTALVARDRWLKPGGIMIPRSVTAWTALVDDPHLRDMVDFLRAEPYGLDLEGLADKTVNEIAYSGAFRHLAAADLRSAPARLWTTDADRVSLEQARSAHETEVELLVHARGTANALALWFSADLAPDVFLSVGPGDPPTHWGMTTAPLRAPVTLEPGTAVRARVRTAPAREAGTWTRWAIAMPGADWEEHDEQAIWEEVDNGMS
jgi:SAM-dependent methyltransferase